MDGRLADARVAAAAGARRLAGAGLATVSNPNPTTIVFTLRPGVKFWDGHPVTPTDVIYSLERQINPSPGGFYQPKFNRVKSITATGAAQVTIKLKQPNYWPEGELSSTPGIIIEKTLAEKEGKNYGTPAGSIMCIGAYMFKSWHPGASVVAVRNPHYWNPSVHPLVGRITIKGIPDIETLTAGLLSGTIQGTYGLGGLPTLGQLEHSSTVRVYQGPGWSDRSARRVQPPGHRRLQPTGHGRICRHSTLWFWP